MGLIFNVNKCFALFVGKSVGHFFKELVLYGDVIPRAEQKCHLGVTFTAGVKLGFDNTNCSRKFIDSAVSVLRSLA